MIDTVYVDLNGVSTLRLPLDGQWLWCGEIFYLTVTVTNSIATVVFNLIRSMHTVYPN